LLIRAPHCASTARSQGSSVWVSPASLVSNNGSSRLKINADSNGYLEVFDDALHANLGSRRLGHHEIEIDAGSVQQFAVSGYGAVELCQIPHMPQYSVLPIGKREREP